MKRYDLEKSQKHRNLPGYFSGLGVHSRDPFRFVQQRSEQHFGSLYLGTTFRPPCSIWGPAFSSLATL